LPTLLAVFDIYEQLNLIIASGLSVAQQPNLDCNYSFNPCEQNLNYWKNYPDNWALNSIPMKLGTKQYYSKNQILDLLNRPVNSDASLVLAKALITGKFNIAQGSEISPIIQTVNTAMNLISDHRLPYDNPVSFSSAIGIQMLALAATLNSYNAGNLNTTPCTGPPVTRINSVNEMESTIKNYSLSVFPNPSSSNTTISFTLPQKEKVSVSVYDANGRLIKILADREFGIGSQQVQWNAVHTAAGVYIIRMETAGHSKIRKLIVTK
jgi:hypothetical protein